MAAKIDVSIEHRNLPEEARDQTPHPNTCPKCDSHYRDDELEANLRVCPHCGFHFPVRARERITQVADEDTFEEEAADLRSEDPLDFFDVRPYPERLVEAELGTGLGDAMIIGRAAIEERPCELAVMDFSGRRSMGTSSARSSTAPRRARSRLACLISITASGGARMQEGTLAHAAAEDGLRRGTSATPAAASSA